MVVESDCHLLSVSLSVHVLYDCIFTIIDLWEKLFLYANNGQVKAHSGRELSPKVTEGECVTMNLVVRGVEDVAPYKLQYY